MGKPVGALAELAGRGSVEVLLTGWGRWKKLYLYERTWIDRRAMRVSTKFRANKSVSEAGEGKKNLSENTNRSFFRKLQNELRSPGEEDTEGYGCVKGKL